MKFTKTDILKYLKDNMPIFEKEYSIHKIGLFGSYSRGEANETSDIDLIYILKDERKITYFQIYNLEKELEKHFNTKVDLINFQYMNPIIKYKSSNDIIYV